MTPPNLPPGFSFFERGWLSSNTLLVHDAGHAVVFDTGYVSHASMLHRLLSSKIGEQPVDLIVNSHLHSDHCGGNFFLQHVYPDVDIQIPSGQFQDVTSWCEEALTYSFTGQNCESFKPSHQLNDGQLIASARYKWQIFSAPGHDNDEFVLFEPEHGILFSADALWENGLGVVFPEFLGGVGFDNVAKTLDLIEALKPRLVLPGHGSVFSDYQTALSNVRRRLDFFFKYPESHAHYSAKVLLKFRLLEMQHSENSEFLNWGRSIPMLQLIHDRFYSSTDMQSWLESLLDELVDRHAATRIGSRILNM